MPVSIARIIGKLIPARASRARRESNVWLKEHAAGIKGHVLSIGSGCDGDGEGRKYRSYFKSCASYTTSEIDPGAGCDMVLDARSMPGIQGGMYDCIFCSAVLEHVDNYQDVLREMTRILKPGGILLLGLPFRQALHMVPHDYYRFTEFGIRHMLKEDYEMIEFKAMDESVPDFPSAYWVKGRKR